MTADGQQTMMERALKERILGASVLVVFVVLVVPIFLDGAPGSSDVVTERVLLPGQEAQDTKTVVLEREREVPIPAAVRRQEAAVERTAPDTSNQDESADTKPSAVESEPQVATSEPGVDPQPSARTPPEDESSSPSVDASSATESSTGMWAVQLGSFSNKANAEALAADLRKQGYAAFLSQLNQGGSALHRVRIGPQKDRSGAEAMAERLQKVGQKGQVVPHP